MDLVARPTIVKDFSIQKCIIRISNRLRLLEKPAVHITTALEGGSEGVKQKHILKDEKH